MATEVRQNLAVLAPGGGLPLLLLLLLLLLQCCGPFKI
jgi:hypothetical protein